MELGSDMCDAKCAQVRAATISRLKRDAAVATTARPYK